MFDQKNFLCIFVHFGSFEDCDQNDNGLSIMWCLDAWDLENNHHYAMMWDNFMQQKNQFLLSRISLLGINMRYACA